MKKKFYIGQEILWQSEDERTVYVKAVVTEVEADHCIAVSQGNENSNLNDLTLWIDADTEIDFCEVDC